MPDKMSEGELKGLQQRLNRGLSDPQTILLCKRAIKELLDRPKAKPKSTRKKKPVYAGLSSVD